MTKSNLYNLLLSYIGIFLGLFNNVFRAKAISIEEIGLLSIIISIVGILQYFSVFGISNTILKFYPTINPKSEKNGFLLLFTVIVTLTLVFTSLIFLFLKPYILKKYHLELLNEYFDYIFIILLINTFLSVFDMVTRVLYKSVESNFYRSFIFKLFHLFLLIYVFISNSSFKFYLNGFILLNFVILAFLLSIIIKNSNLTNFSFKFLSLDFLRKVFPYTFFMLVSFLSGGLVYKIDKLMIGYYLDLKNVGIYTIAAVFATSLAIIPRALSRTVQSDISEAFAKNDLKKVDRIFQDNLQHQLYFSIIISLMIILFSNELLSIIGNEYMTGSLVILFVTIGYLINNSVGLSGEIIALSKYYKFDLYSKIFLFLMTIMFNLIFIPIFGINGAGFATLLTLFTYGLLKLFYIYKKFKIFPQFKANYQFLISCIISIMMIILGKQLFDNEYVIIFVLGFFAYLTYDLILLSIFKYKDTLTEIVFNKIYKLTR